MPIPQTYTYTHTHATHKTHSLTLQNHASIEELANRGCISLKHFIINSNGYIRQMGLVWYA